MNVTTYPDQVKDTEVSVLQKDWCSLIVYIAHRNTLYVCPHWSQCYFWYHNYTIHIIECTYKNQHIQIFINYLPGCPLELPEKSAMTIRIAKKIIMLITLCAIKNTYRLEHYSFSWPWHRYCHYSLFLNMICSNISHFPCICVIYHLPVVPCNSSNSSMTVNVPYVEKQ